MLSTLLTVLLLAPASSLADPVAVVHAEGVAHGFVALHDLDGALLASGDLVQTSKGKRVSTRLRLQFKDGSLHEESATYTQRGHFHLVRDHVVQKGPAFKTQVESTIREDGRVTVRYTEGDGHEKVIEERLKLPPDVVNGMTLPVLKNIPPDARKVTVSYVAITPKPRLVQLEISPEGEESFSTAGLAHSALRYVAKVHVPGITGAIASVLGKIPPDSRFWVVRGEAPTFVKGESPMSMEGPVWRIELVSPSWAAPAASGR